MYLKNLDILLRIAEMCESRSDALSLFQTCKGLYRYRRSILLQNTTVHVYPPDNHAHLQSLDHFTGKSDSLYRNILELEVVVNRCPAYHPSEDSCLDPPRFENVVVNALLALFRKVPQVQTLILRERYVL